MLLLTRNRSKLSRQLRWSSKESRVRLPNGQVAELAAQKEAAMQLMENVEDGVATLIYGPRGVGKSMLAIAVAIRLERPVEVFHLGGGLDPESAVYGQLVLEKGETRFVRSRFVQAITTEDMVIVLDEINRCAAPVHNAIMSVLDFNRRIVIDQESEDRRVVEVAPGVAIVATANLGGEYVGTEPLDAALVDRMETVGVTYPKDEERLLAETGVDAPQAAQLVRLAQAVRQQHERGALTSTMSTRRLLRVSRLVARGHPVAAAFERNVPCFDPAAIAALRATLKAAS